MLATLLSSFPIHLSPPPPLPAQQPLHARRPRAAADLGQGTRGRRDRLELLSHNLNAYRLCDEQII